MRARGFTLLEIMIALFILAIIALGVLQMHLGTTLQRVNDRKRTQAVSLATSRLEQIRRTPLGSVTAANFPNELPVVGMSEFRRYTRITNVGNGTTLRLVDVTVYWSKAGGTFTLRNSLTVSTQVSQ